MAGEQSKWRAGLQIEIEIHNRFEVKMMIGFACMIAVGSILVLSSLGALIEMMLDEAYAGSPDICMIDDKSSDVGANALAKAANYEVAKLSAKAAAEAMVRAALAHEEAMRKSAGSPNPNFIPPSHTIRRVKVQNCPNCGAPANGIHCEYCGSDLESEQVYDKLRNKQ